MAHDNPLHATSIAIGGRGVLLAGRSGSGKSDLALRLIDRGAALVSDDYTRLEARNGTLIASAPPRIAGKIEIRGIGIVAMDFVGETPVAALFDLDASPERLPEADGSTALCGVPIPTFGLAAFEASAPLKVEQALRRLAMGSRA